MKSTKKTKSTQPGRKRGWNLIGGKARTTTTATTLLEAVGRAARDRLAIVYAPGKLSRSQAAQLTPSEKKERRNSQKRAYKSRRANIFEIQSTERARLAPLEAVNWVERSTLETFAEFGRVPENDNLEPDGVTYRFYLAFECVVDSMSSYAAALPTSQRDDEEDYYAVVTPLAGDYTVREFATIEQYLVQQKKIELEATPGIESAAYLGAFVADNFENGKYSKASQKRNRSKRKKLTTQQKRDKRQTYYKNNPGKRKANRGKK